MPFLGRMELKKGDLLEVETGDDWLEMCVGHNFEGYYPKGERISFYPRRFMLDLWRK